MAVVMAEAAAAAADMVQEAILEMVEANQVVVEVMVVAAVW
jgi:hypothetical protein